MPHLMRWSWHSLSRCALWSDTGCKCCGFNATACFCLTSSTLPCGSREPPSSAARDALELAQFEQVRCLAF
jgi:hypothetical protein